MKKQITRIAVHQSSKVIAALYIIFTLPFALIGVIGMMFGAPSKFPFAFFCDDANNLWDYWLSIFCIILLALQYLGKSHWWH